MLYLPQRDSGPLLCPLGSEGNSGTRTPAADSRAQHGGIADRHGTLGPAWINVSFSGLPSPYSGHAWWNGSLLFGNRAPWSWFHSGIHTPNRTPPGNPVTIGSGDDEHLVGLPSYVLSIDPYTKHPDKCIVLLTASWTDDKLAMPWMTGVFQWKLEIAGRTIDQAAWTNLTLAFYKPDGQDDSPFDGSTATITYPAHNPGTP